jgi:hypothetical protein
MIDARSTVVSVQKRCDTPESATAILEARDADPRI